MWNIRKHLRVKILSFILAVVLLLSDFSVGQSDRTSVAFAIETQTGEQSITKKDNGRSGRTDPPAAMMAAEEWENTPFSNLSIETEEPQVSEQPARTEEPQATEQPVQTEKPEETEKPQETKNPDKKIPRLKAVSGVRLVRYTTNSVKVSWKKHKKAKYYRVYYHKKNGKAKLDGITKNTRYLVKGLKNKTRYSFYVVASVSKKASSGKSRPSKEVSVKTRKYIHKTIFAGDSICQAIGYGQAFPQMHMAGKKKVVAYRGLNTVTFHTKRVFNGKTGLQKLISEKPYRVYMMMGMNEIHYRSTGAMIAEYKGMIQRIKKESPDTDIVLCALSPVTRAERARHSGYWQIPVFNKKLKKLAKQTGAHYFDYTAFLKDSGGYLKAGYAERDGYHWKASAYTVFGKLVNKYEKKLDGR